MSDLAIPPERVAQAILLLRGQRVMLDADLAALYGVTIRRLNEQVKRNIARFPEDFMFQLTPEENAGLRSQSATIERGRGQHRKYLPYAFTEHGAVMLASVLQSPAAVEASIQVVRAFIRLRQMLASHADLARKMDALERRYDERFRAVFTAIRQLMAPPAKPRRPIGFRAGAETGPEKPSGRQ